MFPFPSAPFRQYDFTFLKNVHLRIYFKSENPSVLNNNEVKERFADYLHRFFSLKINDPENIKDLKVKVNSRYKPLMIIFGKEYVDIFHDGKGYISFDESMVPAIFRLKSFFTDIVKAEYFTEISLEKENEWEVTADDDEEYTFEKAGELIFNPELLKLIKENPTAPNGQESFSTVITGEIPRFEGETKISINIIDNFHIPGREDNAVTCFQTAFIQDAQIRDFYSMFYIIRSLNKCLYDCFHWSVTQDIIDIMENEQ